MFDRKLLAKLSRCVWKVLGTYLKQAVPKVISFIEDDELIKKYWFIYNCGI
jgi:hypothetical protein